MTIARLINKVLVSLCICSLVSCNETNTKQQQHSIPPKLTGLAGVVTNLPEKPGYATFNNNCVSCHSARYVQMQPDLSEKTWLALVTKMQKTFGAPIADSSIHEIVGYLVAIKGKS